jgi:hypothetical protein
MKVTAPNNSNNILYSYNFEYNKKGHPNGLNGTAMSENSRMHISGDALTSHCTYVYCRVLLGAKMFLDLNWWFKG